MNHEAHTFDAGVYVMWPYDNRSVRIYVENIPDHWKAGDTINVGEETYIIQDIVRPDGILATPYQPTAPRGTKYIRGKARQFGTRLEHIGITPCLSWDEWHHLIKVLLEYAQDAPDKPETLRTIGTMIEHMEVESGQD